MANSSRNPLRFISAVPVLVGILLFACIFVIEARAEAQPRLSVAGLPTDASAFTRPTFVSTRIFFPFMQKPILRPCGRIEEDTIWTLAEGPYQVDCPVLVMDEVTLTIEAGTIISFSQDSSGGLVIRGTLRAVGTEQDPVRFLPTSGEIPGSWGDITFIPSSSGSLDHVILEYGGMYDVSDPGGIVNIYSDAVQVSHSIIRGSENIGLYIKDASPVISASQILSNTGMMGGGVLIDNGSPTIQNNIISGNNTANGGGLSITSGDPLILYNIFTGNSAEIGGGLYISGGSAKIRGNILASNTANSGGGITNAGGTPDLDYNDVWNNSGGDYQGITPGDHDISSDPGWIDPGSGNFHLATGSACIDAGDRVNHPAADFEGDPRPMGLAPDIGVDENRTLGVAKTNISQNIYPGGPVAYRIQLLNNAPITLTNVLLTDTLALEMSFTGYQSKALSCTHDGAAWGGVLHCALDSPSLAPGESRALTLTVTLTDSLSWGQVLTNTVSLSADAGGNALAARDDAPTWLDWCRVQLNDTIIEDDLQAVVDASTSVTDVVKVSGYCRQHDLNLSKTLTLQGGWKWDFSERDLSVYTTTLDAQRLGNVIEVYGIFSPTIEGFVITGGEDYYGGGIFIYYGSPTIRHNLLIHNTAWSAGAGLESTGGNPRILDNTFTANSGAGLYIAGGNAIIENNLVKDNLGYGMGIDSSNSIIRNNAITGNKGRGLYHISSSPTIQHNTFTNNLGDGLYTAYGNALIEDNTFTGNLGNGLNNSLGAPVVRNNAFIGNQLAGFMNISSSGPLDGIVIQSNIFTGNLGGGLNTSNGNPVIQNNTFIGNLAEKGGGLYAFLGAPVIQNNLFMDNSADEGGGLYVLAGVFTVRNNIVVSNTANTGGGVYIYDDTAQPLVDYNDVWNNTGGDYFGVTPGPHNFSADPLMVDPENEDYHLASGSPCIDAGDPANYPPTDFEGDLRPNGSAPDIGPDEYY